MLLCLLSCCVVFRCLLSPPSSAVSCRAVPSSRRFRHRQSGPAVCRALRESYRFDSSSRHGFAIPPDCSSLPPRYTQSCRFAAALMPTAQQFTHMSPVIQLLPGARRSLRAALQAYNDAMRLKVNCRVDFGDEGDLFLMFHGYGPTGDIRNPRRAAVHVPGHGACDLRPRDRRHP